MNDPIPTPSGYEPGRAPGDPYWDGPAGDEMRRLDRLALDELAAKETPR